MDGLLSLGNFFFNQKVSSGSTNMMLTVPLLLLFIYTVFNFFILFYEPSCLYSDDCQ